METLTPLRGHLKKVGPLLGVPFFARSSITRARLQSGHSINGSPDSLPVGYTRACAPMELPPCSCLLSGLLQLEYSAMCDMVTVVRGQGWAAGGAAAALWSGGEGGGRRGMRHSGGGLNGLGLAAAGWAHCSVTAGAWHWALLTRRSRGMPPCLPHAQRW